MGEGADGARDLAHAQVFGGGPQTHQIAPGFAVPDGQLQPESDRLGMHAVGAADLHSVFELQGAPLQHGLEALQSGQQNPASLADLQGLRRIDDIVGGEPVVQPARRLGVTGGLHALGHRRGEGDHVVLDLLLDFENAGGIEAGMRP